MTTPKKDGSGPGSPKSRGKTVAGIPPRPKAPPRKRKTPVKPLGLDPEAVRPPSSPFSVRPIPSAGLGSSQEAADVEGPSGPVSFHPDLDSTEDASAADQISTKTAANRRPGPHSHAKADQNTSRPLTKAEAGKQKLADSRKP